MICFKSGQFSLINNKFYLKTKIMSKKVTINCNQASSICNKNQYCEASFIDKLKLSLHNFLCNKCKIYSEQNTFMSKLFKKHLNINNNYKLCDEEKAVLKVNLNKEFNE